jgi:hypothetical protein
VKTKKRDVKSLPRKGSLKRALRRKKKQTTCGGDGNMLSEGGLRGVEQPKGVEAKLKTW